ncbi:hypothetical protein ONZ45_g6991 [Pleurotus djamor]|nr:hypothetical protein ONZ45_g6991 [Pleurotus djamor]
MLTRIQPGASIFAVSEVRRIQPSLEFFFNFTGTFGPTLYIFFSLAAFAEVVFGTFVCYLLRHSRREFFNPQAMVATSLSNYAVASGLLASALQVAIVLTCALLPGNFAFFAIQMILPSVLGNSYLALMNARHVFRHGIRCKDAPNLPFNDSRVTVHVSASTTFTDLSA